MKISFFKISLWAILIVIIFNVSGFASFNDHSRYGSAVPVFSLGAEDHASRIALSRPTSIAPAPPYSAPTIKLRKSSILGVLLLGTCYLLTPPSTITNSYTNRTEITPPNRPFPEPTFSINVTCPVWNDDLKKYGEISDFSPFQLNGTACPAAAWFEETDSYLSKCTNEKYHFYQNLALTSSTDTEIHAKESALAAYPEQIEQTKTQQAKTGYIYTTIGTFLLACGIGRNVHNRRYPSRKKGFWDYVMEDYLMWRRPPPPVIIPWRNVWQSYLHDLGFA